MTSDLPPMCPEIGRDHSGYVRRCVLDLDHDGDHQDARGDTWEPPEVALPRLRARWGHSHHIVYLPSGLWMATAYDPNAYWKTEVEPTVEQLDTMIGRHTSQAASAATT
ncbi:hypothetical protein [Nocardiopsis lucentensis]|uniref:hypothetical protein n=1 Tax=Nocardiopsis lucentensis TaxID=53441 RepID=UPI00034BD52F|nr:hypothetical protein [Nocardiopsis lucentensis]